MRYVTAFDGKTLHDGTNRYSKSKLPITKAAQVEKVLMANQVWFDPNYGTGSTAVPQPFDSRFYMRFDNKAAAEAEIAALAAKIGDNGTVTAARTSGGAAETCNATLQRADVTHRSTDFSFLVTLHFEPFDDWS